MLRSLITLKGAATGLIIILSAVMIFHVLVITGIIPYSIVWGGRLQSKAEMVNFEIVSLLLNSVILALTLIRGGYWPVRIRTLFLRIVFGLLCILFLVNTVGNLFAESDLERNIFTPITLLLSFLTLRLAGAH